MEINPFVPFKILSCYEKIDQILRGKMPVPQTLELFVSDRCNHSCVGCHSKMLHNLSNDFLDFKLIKRLFREVSVLGVRGIEISGGGEPLMHPEIINIVKCATKNKMKVGVLTNGTLLNGKMIDEFLKDLLFIRISFDATDGDLYRRIHSRDDLDKVLKNIKRLIAERKRTKSPITIGLKMLVSEFNYSEIINTAKTAKLLKADYIQFKPLRKSLHAIPNTMELFVKESIDEARKLFSDNKFKVLGSAEKSTIKKRCFLNPLHPVVDTTGDVYLCAFFQHRMDTHRIGNLHKHTFREIWYSKRHYKAFKNNDYQNCRHFDCPLQAPVPFIEDTVINDKLHIEFI